MAARKSTAKTTAKGPNTEASKPEKAVEEPEVSQNEDTKEMKTVKCAPHPALNVRKAPSMDAGLADEVSEYPDGAEIECEAPVDGWCKTPHGYVKAEFLA